MHIYCLTSIFSHLSGKQVKTQEYYLGHWSPEKQTKLEAEIQALQETKATPKTTKVEGLTLPYVEMAMDDGKEFNKTPTLKKKQCHFVFCVELTIVK